MKREEDQQLWDLLGRAAEPKISPFFARNVLRKLREEPRWFDRILTFVPAKRLVPAAGVAAVVVAAALLFNQSGSHTESVVAGDDVAAVDEQDYDVIADLDNLLAMEESNLWDDDDTSSL